MTAPLELVPLPDDRSSEIALARAAAAGDGDAFERLYREHSARVFALCLRMSGSRGRATELVQDVFVQVWRRLDSWRGESALGSWIHRVAINVVLSNARAERRRHTKEMSDGDESGAEEEERPALRSVGVARPASVAEGIDLERAIAALPERARIVFVLHDVEGYQHDEIATMTGTAPGTCRAQLHRARRLLMESLGEDALRP